MADPIDRADACAAALADRSSDVDRSGEIPPENFDLLQEHGLLGLGAAEEHGGLALGFVPSDNTVKTAILERLAEGCPNTAHCYLAHLAAEATVRLYGRPDQQQYFADAVNDDRALFTYYGAEPTQEFDSTGGTVTFDTTAAPDGDGWVVDGTKFFATNSVYADYHMVFALEEGAADLPSGMMVVAIPDDADGLTVADTWDGMGQRATKSGLVELDAVHVPEEYVISAPGEYREFGVGNFEFKFDYAAIFSGITQRALRFAEWYLANEAKPPAGLESLAEDPHVQLRIADAATSAEAAHQLVRHAAEQIERVDYDEEATMERARTAALQAYVFAGETAITVSSDIFQVCGARATTAQYNADRFWRNARTLVLHEVVDKLKATIGRTTLDVDADGAS